MIPAHTFTSSLPLMVGWIEPDGAKDPAGGGEHNLMLMQGKGLTLHVESMLFPLLGGSGRAEQGKILRETAKLVDEGKLKPLIDPNAFTIDRVADAHRHLESGKAVGKVVLTW